MEPAPVGRTWWIIYATVAILFVVAVVTGVLLYGYKQQNVQVGQPALSSVATAAVTAMPSPVATAPVTVTQTCTKSVETDSLMVATKMPTISVGFFVCDDGASHDIVMTKTGEKTPYQILHTTDIADGIAASGGTAIGFEAGDYNFDGNLDFRTVAQSGSMWLFNSHSYWLYDPKTGGFTYAEAISAGGNYTFDAKAKTVTSYEYSVCGTLHDASVYCHDEYLGHWNGMTIANDYHTSYVYDAETDATHYEVTKFAINGDTETQVASSKVAVE